MRIKRLRAWRSALLAGVPVLMAGTAVAAEENRVTDPFRPPEAVLEQMEEPETERVTDLLGRTVVSRDGKRLGIVEDLALGEEGRVRYVVLSSEGPSGGDDENPIPWEKVGGERRGAVKRSASAGSEVDPLPGESAVWARDWLERPVFGEDGKRLGRVQDLYFSPERRISFAIVQDPQGRMHPIPTEMFEKDAGDDGLQAAFDRETFERSPGFKADHLSTLVKGDWDRRIRGYYQARQ
jgi:sporulation protein YlmC with PRC-barrel domain